MSDDNRQTIHIRIRDLRREHSLTQEELAEALGLSRQSINAMEAGRCLPSLPVAVQIAAFFSVPLNRVFGIDVTADPVPSSLPIIEGSPMNSLTPWSPLREMRQALDELMDENTQWSAPQMSLPSVNIYQAAREVVMEIQLPGYRKEDLSIEVGEDFLAVAGEVPHASEEEGRQYIRREFAKASFSRTVALPAIVQAEQAQAEMKHGILTVRIPKVIEEKPKTARISIKSAE